MQVTTNIHISACDVLSSGLNILPALSPLIIPTFEEVLLSFSQYKGGNRLREVMSHAESLPASKSQSQDTGLDLLPLSIDISILPPEAVRPVEVSQGVFTALPYNLRAARNFDTKNSIYVLLRSYRNIHNHSCFPQVATSIDYFWTALSK